MVGGVLGAFLGGLYSADGGVEMGCCAPISTFRTVLRTSPYFSYINILDSRMSVRPLHPPGSSSFDFGTAVQVHTRIWPV